MSDKKNYKFWNCLCLQTISISVFFAIVAVMIVAYFCTFHGKLSANSEHWGDFGSYFGSITGLLAFAGVLWSIYETRKQNTETSERDSFFKMLELHSDKVYNTEFLLEKGSEPLRGVKAFKKFVDLSNKYLKLHLLKKYYNQFPKVINMLDIKYQAVLHYTNDPDFKIEPNALNEIINSIGDAHAHPKISTKECFDIMRNAADEFYNKYGHNTGHYFRNFYYTMKITDGFKGEASKDYHGILRAQLSRYEIALGLYNALSSRSSEKLIPLLRDYDLFKDIYSSDVTIFDLPIDIDVENGKDKTEQIIEALLTHSEEYLKENGRNGK